MRNYLTKELVEQLDLYVYRREDDEWVWSTKIGVRSETK